MRSMASIVVVGLISVALLALPGATRAEVIEEIVAWVNGDIITSTDLEEEEQAMISEAYRRYTGEELDLQVKKVREEILLRMVDRKILMQKAKMMFDTERMGQVFYESFKEQQGITDDAELEQALEREGMTVEDLRERLIEMFAPEEILRFEVGNRIAVGDMELETYYAAHTDEFIVPAEVTVREIVLMAETDAEKERRRADAEAIRRRATTEDFGELATEMSEAGTAAEGGLLGPVTRGELSEALEQAAFELPVGEISNVMELPHGFHIVKVETRTEDTVTPLEELRERLRGWLEDRKYLDELQIYMAKVRKEADWCVKAKFTDRLPPDTEDQTCTEL